MSDILAVDLIRALWDDARHETDEERKAQLERDATALEDVWSRSKYALAPTRDQMTAALGNASLNIADTLAALASSQRQVDQRVSEIHEYVQQNNTLFSQFFEMFPPRFEAFQEEARAAWEESGRRLEKHDDDIEALTRVVQEHKADHDTRITSLEDYRADMQALRAALAALSARIDSALPTEADQALSTELRGSEAERASDGS